MVRDSVIRVEVEGYIMGKNGQNIQNLGNAGLLKVSFSASQPVDHAVSKEVIFFISLVCIYVICRLGGPYSEKL